MLCPGTIEGGLFSGNHAVLGGVLALFNADWRVQSRAQFTGNSAEAGGAVFFADFVSRLRFVPFCLV